jgi:hypothetical protein
LTWTGLDLPRRTTSGLTNVASGVAKGVANGRVSRLLLLSFAGLTLLLLYSGSTIAHQISEENARFLNQIHGFQFMIYLYLGAKHMVTGYDHLLFLFGVIFYLTTLRSIGLYVSLFAIGHSITLILGVLADFSVNVYLIDAIIGLSVVYKAFDNLGGFQRLFGIEQDSRVAVFVFGLFHGLGLATKVQEISLSDDGLVANLLSFNLGVEIGQILALVYLLLLLLIIHRMTASPKVGIITNVVLMTGGFALTTYQLAYYMAPGVTG